MQEELQEEVAQLRQKLQKTEADFQNYKKSSKQLQEFLQQESTKKEAEIRKLKEELILKDKALKQIKQQLQMSQNDNTALRAQSAKDTNESLETAKYVQLIKKAEVQITQLRQKNNEFASKFAQVENQVKEAISQKNSERGLYETKIQYLSEELSDKAKRIESLEQQKAQLGKASKPTRAEQVSRKDAESENNHKKQLEFLRLQFHKEREQLEEKIRKLQQGNFRVEKQLKDYKNKVQGLIEDNERLQSRTVNVTINSINSSPSPMLIKSSLEDQDLSLRPSYHCLVMTKPHYISPFLEIYEQKSLIKIYKSSRSGCFQKSMGCYKHKFDRIAFDHENVLQPIVNRIKQYQEQTQHSIYMFGVKKSNKKYLMSKLVVSLKDFLLQKIDSSEQVEAIFVKRSQEEQKNLVIKGTDKETVLEVIDKVIALGYKNQKTKHQILSPRKNQSKPKVRYFKLRIGEFALEIGTSSFTNLSFRQKNTVSAMLNNLLYSKLPNILQSSLAQKYIVLTLNPIVDLYEDCKNTLSSTFCRNTTQQNRDDVEADFNRSPIRNEHLNDIAKKKLQSFERQNEETSLKIRKLEDECGFYRARFDELQFRLKNLLNTHSQQNTYLKKSPITLSYEKLLKFVHSVQSRNGITLSGNQSLLKASNIYSEKDPQSLQAL